jgi:capsular polysaccharide biosynthesis protein
MSYEAVFIFDSSYKSLDVALPIEDERLHIAVSNRRIEPPPGHSSLQLEVETNFASFWRNLRSLRKVWTKAKGEKCVVIAAVGIRSEQLALNSIYAFSLSRNVAFFDGVSCYSAGKIWRKLLRAAATGPAQYIFRRLRLRLNTAIFNHKVRALLVASTKEGSLFGLYTRTRTFSLPFDKVTFEPDGRPVYGHVNRAWYLPAFSSRRQRFTVETTRHVLHNVTLHVEKVEGVEVSSLFKDGRILDYPYMLGPEKHRYTYPVSSRGAVKTAERGINLLAYSRSYYHWLVEAVPRILDVIDDGFDFDRYPLFLPPLESFQRQLLEVLGVNPDRQVITVDMGEWCHVGECVFPTANFPFGTPELEDPSGQPDRALLMRIRERLIERLAFTPTFEANTPKRLYVSRAKASKRKFTVQTEGAITSVLESCGFTKVCLEDLTWPAQVQLIAGADFIAGMHGAGLTNILFSNAKALLEFHNPMETRPYFAVMARELDINYAYIIGSLQGASPNFDNITIDLRAAEAMVKQMTASQ